MSACIIASINIEAPEECDVERLVADIWYCVYRFYLGTGKIIQGHHAFSSPADGTQGINIELAINEELFADARKIVDALIEKIEEQTVRTRKTVAYMFYSVKKDPTMRKSNLGTQLSSGTP